MRNSFIALIKKMSLKENSIGRNAGGVFSLSLQEKKRQMTLDFSIIDLKRVYSDLQECYGFDYSELSEEFSSIF